MLKCSTLNLKPVGLMEKGVQKKQLQPLSPQTEQPRPEPGSSRGHPHGLGPSLPNDSEGLKGNLGFRPKCLGFGFSGSRILNPRYLGLRV